MQNIFILATNTCFGLACFIEDLKNYKGIYEIKNRDFSKPMAILIDDFNFFEKNKILSKKQIDFLKNYKNPFTILVSTEKLKKIGKKKSVLKKILKTIKKLPNSQKYEKIAFRVAHDFEQKKLTKGGKALFLTSANKSGNPEIFSCEKIEKEFEKEIKNFGIKVLAEKDFSINSKQKSSDIFEFVGDSLEIVYFRTPLPASPPTGERSSYKKN